MEVTPDMIQGADAEEIRNLIAIAQLTITIPSLFKPELRLTRRDGMSVVVSAEMTLPGWRTAVGMLLDLPKTDTVTPVRLVERLADYSRITKADTTKALERKVDELTADGWVKTHLGALMRLASVVSP